MYLKQKLKYGYFLEKIVTETIINIYFITVHTNNYRYLHNIGYIIL